jgi:CPA2 family monovalent cation:H+ antiporter-2
MGELAILQDLFIIFAVAVAVVIALRWVGVPSLAGLILAGVIIGPRSAGIIEDVHEVSVLSEIGVVLLLFGIGLELSLDRLKRLLKPILLGGGLQMTLTVAGMFGISTMFGLGYNTSLFIGFLVAVSSTAIVLRALEARGEIDAPHGRLTLGILVFQDLAVVPMMLAIPILSGESQLGFDAALLALKAVGVLAGVLLSARLLVPKLLQLTALTRQRDIFVLTLFLTCVGTAWLASLAGVSLSLGAFLAGLVVASSAFRYQAMADLIPFREILASVFFVSVGMLLDPLAVVRNAGPIALLLAMIVTGKFAIVFLVGLIMRLPLRVAIMAGVSLAQMGEFAFVLTHAARETTLLPDTISSNLNAAAVLSMLFTPLVVLLGPHIAAGAGKVHMLVKLLDVRPATEAEKEETYLKNHVIIAGYGIGGSSLSSGLKTGRIPHIIVDLNPTNVRQAAQEGSPAYYGDITSDEILEHLGIHHASDLVILINDPEAARRAVVAARRIAPKLHIVVRTRYLDEVKTFRTAGADRVVPAEIAASLEVMAHILNRHNIDDSIAEDVTQNVRGECLSRH